MGVDEQIDKEITLNYLGNLAKQFGGKQSLLLSIYKRSENMKLYIDLVKRNEKNPLWVFIGLMFLVASMLWITPKLLNSELIGIFDWFYFSFFALNGVVHTIGGLGYPVEGLIGKAFIEVDNNSIKFKFGVLKKEEAVNWENIQTIDFKTYQFLICRKDNTYLTFPLFKLEYAMVQKIKNTITELATKKEIRINQ
ncbi:hypothetical protein BZG02_08190 [Labilibaculum filiforme]|uniref:YcxB-like protein domain-containing protein n=1 Tax=Labilibaculum filiforme TaxID=1940526 RepID=A0A2N3I0Z9_9BACT|nr:hypothetical protein [Labilibaculum filiforme]PKQ63982.1 hypothetical protein BZG02_08190 [Labilibaculum filiforme]